MVRGKGDGDARGLTYARACAALERAGRVFGVSSAKTLARARRGNGWRASRLRAVAEGLELGAVPSRPESVLAASISSSVIVAVCGSAGLVLSILYLGETAQVAVAVIAFTSPVLCYRYLVTYPSAAARRRASGLMKRSAEGISLMVMGVRQDTSLPRAIEFASVGTSVFACELRRCTWEVITGTYTSFEDAVHAFGSRWEKSSSELKTALNAIVVATREATEEGKRRSLERANRAMVAGAKRRIEEYALSLSTPSMLLFGLGILLPIMVGSFMPMLSWDIWSTDLLDGGASHTGRQTLDTAIVMDVVFPVVAFLVASDAVSRRPFDRPDLEEDGARARRAAAASLATGAGCAVCAFTALGAGEFAPLVLLSGALPASAVLLISFPRSRPVARAQEDEVQDLLFKVGAKMLDGDNLESALYRSARGEVGAERPLGRSLCLKAFALGQGLERAVVSEAREKPASALEALKVVARASTKDEAHAGLMAMDIASYLRELSEIESTLRMRLRPTISMMRMTAHVLGPLVLGITFAIYVSLGSVAGGYGDAGAAGEMLLVLGLFLAEMNAVVCYFVWGIEGRTDTGGLASSIGACVLISQLVFVSTAVLSA